ncbi:MAG: zinc-dependent metalloprotease [Bryobacteraceae bacterium]
MKRCLVLALLGASMIWAQEQPPAPQAEPALPAPAAVKTQEPAAPRPYEKVITSEARTRRGVFTVHQLRDRLYYEIPNSEFGREFLWVVTLSRTTLGAGYGGTAVANRVVRWERRDRRVLLRSVSYEIVADEKEPISRAVRAANNESILMAFNIEAVSKDDAPVIDVTRLFTTEVAEFSPRRILGARGFDASRSFIERVAAFPENINVEATQTYTIPLDATPAGAPAPTPSQPGAGRMRQNTGTVVLHHSMVRLPEKPMMLRLADERLGYFSIRRYDYGTNEHRATERRYIVRWRLEKKDPKAAVSEPVKPIVYYVDPATPAKWVPYVKKGIEAWQPAFEEAGFRRAIIAREAPSPEEDPDWSPEDARYSVVRWLPSTTRNAVGPNIHDPRSGEILDADIQVYHNVLELLRDWYFSQVGPLDPRAARLPLSDELMGELIAYVITHEVGHTLGLPHNFKASSTYPIEKLRDPGWLRTMGHTPTLMDYCRFNYVAQPEDKIPPELLIPRIGPYDKFSIMWGYKPVPGATTPEEEKKTLNEWLKVQETTPWLRFSTARAAGADPGDVTEAVGDADPVQATTLGTKNIRRALDMLLTAVPKEGENYEELGVVYAAVLGQWSRELGHVAGLVGGFDSQNRVGGQPGVAFTPVPRARQKAAVGFLNKTVFATPEWVVRPEIIRRIEPTGALNRVLTLQRSVLTALLAPARMTRLQEQQALDGNAAYRPVEFLADLRQGIFTELNSPSPVIDSYRRNLQRAYLDMLDDRLNPRSGAVPTDDTRALFRGELRAIDSWIAGRLGATTDRTTQFHLREMRDRIAQILDPKFVRPAAAGSTASSAQSLEVEEDTCWPDLGREFRPQAH